MIAAVVSPFLTVRDVSQQLQVSEKTVRRMIHRGELRAYRVGRLLRIEEKDVKRARRQVAKPTFDAATRSTNTSEGVAL